MPSEDRRVRRTKAALAEAFMDLVPRRSYDRLKIGELIEGAEVARSTFYQHFADKDDYLITSYVRLLGMCVASKAPPTRETILPVRGLFEHMYENRAFAQAITKSRVYDAQMVAGEEKLREIAAARLAIAVPDADAGPLAVFLAGALTGLLRWWKSRGLPETPAELEAIFQRLTAGALDAAIPARA